MTTARRMQSACAILVCSLLAAGGCDVSLGPVTRTHTIVVKPGTGVEILSPATVRARVLGSRADGSHEEIRQDIGGWIALHPDHWDSVKATLTRLRGALREVKERHGEALTPEEQALLGAAPAGADASPR